jgi:hypothetical protein
MDLSSTTLSLKWNGDEYSLKHPSVRQHMAYTEQLQKKKGKEVECLIDFLEGLGLPKQASLEMELGHLQQVVSALTGAKNQGK